MRDKPIELIEEAQYDFLEMQAKDDDPIEWDMRTSGEYIADHLRASGVVVATDNNAGCKGCLYENRKRPQKCSCCSRNIDMKDCYTPDFDRHWTERPPKGE